jgi:hypothetical protein
VMRFLVSRVMSLVGHRSAHGELTLFYTLNSHIYNRRRYPWVPYSPKNRRVEYEDFLPRTTVLTRCLQGDYMGSRSGCRVNVNLFGTPHAPIPEAPGILPSRRTGCTTVTHAEVYLTPLCVEQPFALTPERIFR